ncbi:hypothetical protein QP185_03080 [Sphingomonas aerolata]|uniref:hypothetical protein n=1 Tax=Sphingomonas aerolata TaxID=185951 RepID=UPI002FE41A1A
MRALVDALIRSRRRALPHPVLVTPRLRRRDRLVQADAVAVAPTLADADLMTLFGGWSSDVDRGDRGSIWSRMPPT